MITKAPALPRPDAQPTKVGHGAGTHGPLSFVGWMPFLFGVAYIPSAHLTAVMLLNVGFPLFWAVACVGLLFPALLLPTLPTRSRRALMRNSGWLRGIFAALPVTAAVVILQMAMMTDDLSIQGFFTVGITAVCALFCAMLIVFDAGLLEEASTQERSPKA